jgi:hypothetical protein
VDDEELWWDPAAPEIGLSAAAEAVRLLPLYDELTLSYPRLSFPISARHPHPPDDDLRWGSVIADLTNVGLWRRTVVDGRRPKVRLAATVDPITSPIRRVAVEAELDRMATFLQAEPVKEDWIR